MSIQLEKRPLLPVLAGLILGLTAVDCPLNLLLLIPLLLFCRSIRNWILVAVSMGLGLFLAPSNLPILAVPDYSTDSIRVVSVPYRTPVDIRCNARIGSFQVRLIAPPESRLHFGDTLRGGALLSPVPEDRESTYRAEGIQAVAKLNQVTLTQAGPRIFRDIDAFRSVFLGYVGGCATADQIGWVDALWFRSRTISTKEQTDVVASGAYSFVAASGVQVYILFGLVVWVLGGVFRLDRKVQISVAFGLLCLYWLLTGMHGNTLRGCLTCIVLSSAYLFKREPDLCSVAALAGVFYLMAFPRSVWTLGFQVSIMVPMAIGFFAPAAGGGILERRFSGLLRILTIVFLAGQPLIAAHQGQIGLAQFAATFILGLIAPVVLVGSMIGFVVNCVSIQVGQGLLLVLVLPLTDLFAKVVETLANLHLQFDLPPVASPWLWVYYGLWVFLWREQARPSR